MMFVRLRQVFAPLALTALASLPAAEPASAPPGGAEMEITAEVAQVDAQSGEAIWRRNARLTYGGWTIVADEIRFNRATDEARATGNVLLTHPALRLIAERALYRLKERTIELENFRFGRPPLHFSGQRAHGTAAQLTLENVEVYYGDPGFLAPHASARSLVLHEGRRINARGLRFSIGTIPLLSFSGLARPLEFPRVLTENRAGYDNSLGLEAGLGVFYPVVPGFAPGGTIDWFSERGALYGPGARYDATLGDAQVQGSTDALFITDHGKRGIDVWGRPIDRDRYFWSWQHRQRSSDRWTLNGELNAWSDSAVFRDFREELFDLDQEPDSFLEGSWNGSNYIVSAFARYRPNDFQIMPERLPEVRFDLLPTSLGATGVLLEMKSGVAALRERPVINGSEVRSDRADVYAGLSRTWSARGVSFTPVLGGRFTQYNRATAGRDDYTRWLGEVGFDARMRAYRIYNVKNPIWGIDGLRHVLEPSVEYRYVPDADKGRPFIPEIDRPAFLTQLQPLGLADRRDIDALGAMNVARLKLTNIFETRRTDYGSRELAQLTLATDVFFSGEANDRTFSDLHAELRVTPADWLSWWVFLRFDPEHPALRELNNRIELIDGRTWSVVLDTDYLQHDLEQLQLFGRYEINEANELSAGVRYDARENRFNELRLGLGRRLTQNWLLRIGLNLRDGPRRESGFGLRLDLQFLSF